MCNENNLDASNIPACELSYNYSLEIIVKRMKNNPYVTKEHWEEKRILNVHTGEYYSYADLDQLFNN